jgi:hypothetical protein
MKFTGAQLHSVRPEMVDFDPGQGRSEFSTTFIPVHVKGRKERDHRHGPKDDIYGWTLLQVRY